MENAAELKNLVSKLIYRNPRLSLSLLLSLFLSLLLTPSSKTLIVPAFPNRYSTAFDPFSVNHGMINQPGARRLD